MDIEIYTHTFCLFSARCHTALCQFSKQSLKTNNSWPLFPNVVAAGTLRSFIWFCVYYYSQITVSLKFVQLSKKRKKDKAPSSPALSHHFTARHVAPVISHISYASHLICGFLKRCSSVDHQHEYDWLYSHSHSRRNTALNTTTPHTHLHVWKCVCHWPVHHQPFSTSSKH